MEGCKRCEECEYYLDVKQRAEAAKNIREGLDKFYKMYPQYAPCNCKTRRSTHELHRQLAHRSNKQHPQHPAHTAAQRQH